MERYGQETVRVIHIPPDWHRNLVKLHGGMHVFFTNNSSRK